MRSLARTTRFALGAGLAGASLACALANPTPVAWSLTAAPTPSALPGLPPAAQENLPRPTTHAVPSVAVTPPALPETSAPWAVFLDEAGSAVSIWDGSGGPLRRIALPGALLPDDLVAGLHPLSPLLAGRTADPDGRLSLQLIDLAAGSVQELTPLLTEAMQTQAGGDPQIGAVIAVQMPGGLRWSPDGRFLAFIAAIDGPSADLYLYEPAQDQLRRLTRGIRQAATPFWSPDSLWVLVQELEQAEAGSDWNVTAVWAAAVSGTETRKLYTPPNDSIAETFLAWTGAETVTTYTRTAASGRLVREVPLNTRWLNPVFSGPFETLAFDPVSRLLLYSVREPLSGRAGLLPGVYRVAADTDSPEMVGVGDWTAVRWLASQQVFLASGSQGALIVPLAGEGRLFQGEGWAQPAPDGLWIAGWGGALPGQTPGVRLYDPNGRLLETITTDPVDDLVWQPDSQALFYHSQGKLYRSAFPATRPTQIGDGLGMAGFVLIPVSAP